MYSLYSQAYRSTHPREEFLKLTRLVRYDIVEFHIVRMDIKDDRASVTLAYSFRAPALDVPQPLTSELTDVWVREGADGLWCKEQEESMLPFLPTGPGASQLR